MLYMKVLCSFTINTLVSIYVSADSSYDTTYSSALYSSNAMTVTAYTNTEKYLELPSSKRLITAGSTLTLTFNGNFASIVTSTNSQLIITFRNLIFKPTSSILSCDHSLTCIYTSISSTMN